MIVSMYGEMEKIRMDAVRYFENWWSRKRVQIYQ